MVIWTGDTEFSFSLVLLVPSRTCDALICSIVGGITVGDRDALQTVGAVCVARALVAGGRFFVEGIASITTSAVTV